MLKRIALLSLACIFIASCSPLTPFEKRRYENLIAQGAQPVAPNNPWLAGALNLGPGLGDAYNGEWDAFAFDLLLWYASPIWAVPQAAITAGNVNKRATIAFYTSGPGKYQGFDPDDWIESGDPID